MGLMPMIEIAFQMFGKMTDAFRGNGSRFGISASWVACCLIAGLFFLSPGLADAQEDPPFRHAITMYGEPALPADYTHLSYANPDAPKGGTLTHGVIGTYDSLNPFILNSMRTTARGMWEPVFGNMIFESLMFRSRDEPFTLYGLLADGARMPDDRSWIEFHLNDKAKWSDGTPVTPEDVIFTYDILTKKGRPPFSSRSSRIEKIEKTGPQTVKFTFNETSDREFPLLIAGFTPVLPRHATDVDNFDASTLTPPLGSGPYLIEKMDAGKNITYKKRDDYWGKDLPVKRGFDNFERISVEYFRQQNSLFEAFKKGLIDVFADNNPASWERAYDFPAVTDGRVVKEEFISGAPENMMAFIFNTRRPVFADRNVREALSMLFDFESINKNLFFGKYSRTESFWDGSKLSAVGHPASDAERAFLAGYPGQVPESIMDGTWRLPVSDGSGADRKILREAFTILKKAGYERQSGSLTGPDGKQLAFEIMTKNLDEEKLALAYQRTLSRLGIKVDIRGTDDAQYQRRLQDFDYDMIVGAYSASLSPGAEQTWRWGSKSRDIPGSFNYAGVSDPAVDAAINRILSSRSEEDFISAVRVMDRLLLSGFYVVPLFHVNGEWVARWSRVTHPETTPLYGNRYPVWWYAGE